MSQSDPRIPFESFKPATDYIGRQPKNMVVGAHRIYRENPRNDGKRSFWVCLRCKKHHKEQKSFEKHGCTERLRHGNLKIVTISSTGLQLP